MTRVFLAFLPLLLSSPVAQAQYEPFVPKTPPTTKIIVLDVSKDKEKMRDGLAAVACIQGLVNRASNEKIFLKNVPFRCYYAVDQEDPRNASRVGRGNPYEYMLDELLPYPREEPQVDETQQAPVLHYLLTHYKDLIKGKVLYQGSWDEGGPLALNTAIFEDGIVVNQRTDQYIRSLGFDFPLLADCTNVSSWFEAQEQAIKKYFDHPKRNDRFIGFGTTCVMLDYCMATHSFVTYFDKRKAKNKEQEDEMHHALQGLCARYPDGIPVAGYIEITRAHHAVNDAGCQPVCGELPNTSVLSSVPTNPSKFHDEKPGKALDIDPNGVYITWYGIDIDAIDFSLLIYKSLRNDPNGGKAPLFIKMNPFLIDWWPGFFEWCSKLYPDQVDFFYSPYGDGPPPESTRSTTCAHYVANSNGAFGSDQVNPENHLPIFELMGGYAGDMGDYKSTWALNKGTVWASKLGGMRLGPKNPGPYDPDVAETVRYIKTSILNYAETGKPYFILGRVPSECGIEVFSLLVEAQNRLNADPEITRNLYFVRPFDIAATYKRYRESGLHKKKMEVFSGDPMEGLKSTEPRVRRAAASVLLQKGAQAASLVELERLFKAESDRRAKRFLALAIGQHDEKAQSAIPALVATLPDETAGPGAAKALSQIGASALNNLLETVQGGQLVAKANAARAIKWMGEDAQPAVPKIVQILESERNAAVKVSLIKALGGIGDASAVDILIKQTQSEHKPVLRAAAEALGQIGDPKAVPALVRLLDSDNAFDGGIAAAALGDLGPAAKKAVPKLMELINKQWMDRYFQGQAAIALGRIGAAEAIPRLIEFLKARVQLCSDATLALSYYGPQAKDAVPHILEHPIKHPWPEPRYRAVKSLAAIGPPAKDALLVLKQLATEDRDQMVRQAASEAVQALQ